MGAVESSGEAGKGTRRSRGRLEADEGQVRALGGSRGGLEAAGGQFKAQILKWYV